MSSIDKDVLPLKQSSRFSSNSLQLGLKKKKEKLLVWIRTEVENNCALLMEIVGEKTRKAVFLIPDVLNFLGIHKNKMVT